MQRMRGEMPMNVVEALADNIRKFKILGVRFIRWGEPTLHPKYIEIMDKVKKAGALVHLNTNGSLLDETQIRSLINIHLDSIKFSFQGADEGTYNEMREGGDYLKLLKTIKLFHEMRGSKNYPFIQVSTTLTTENKEQVENFKNDVQNYCDYYNIGYTKLGLLNVYSMKISDEEKNKLAQLQKSQAVTKKYIDVCTEAFDKLSINWNGDVTLCCSDYDNFMIVGNILDNNIKQIFNSNAAKIYREIILKKQYGKIKCCSNCYQYIPSTNS